MTEPAGGAPDAGTWLRRNAQHQVAGLTVGIISVNPDPDDPAVRLGVRDSADGRTLQVVLRPGRPAEVLGRVLVAETIDREARAAVLLTVRAAQPQEPPAADSGLGRVGWILLLAGVALVLVLGGAGTGFAWWHSRPAPGMSAQAQQQGAVRLTYRFRHLPNAPTLIQVPGVGEVGLALFDVAPRDGKVRARISGPGGSDHRTQEVWLGRGQSALLDRVRVSVVDLYDQPDPANDAADVVVTAAG